MPNEPGIGAVIGIEVVFARRARSFGATRPFAVTTITITAAVTGNLAAPFGVLRLPVEHRVSLVARIPELLERAVPESGPVIREQLAVGRNEPEVRGEFGRNVDSLAPLTANPVLHRVGQPGVDRVDLVDPDVAVLVGDVGRDVGRDVGPRVRQEDVDFFDVAQFLGGLVKGFAALGDPLLDAVDDGRILRDVRGNGHHHVRVALVRVRDFGINFSF